VKQTKSTLLYETFYTGAFAAQKDLETLYIMGIMFVQAKMRAKFIFKKIR
jgi:hypothetical protein